MMVDASPSLHSSPARAPSRDGVHHVFPAFSDGATLQTQVMSFVLGHIVHDALLLVIALNVWVFGHYGLELFYAIILSEALFGYRVSMLQALSTITSKEWSPKQAVKRLLTSVKGWILLAFLSIVVYQFTLSLRETILVFSVFLLFLVILDRKALFLFRIHHLVISDESLVSFVLVFFLVACLGVFVGSFLVLALKDAAAAVDATAIYLNEHMSKDPLVRQRFGEVLSSGKSHIDSFSRNLQEQYQGTPYGPAVSLTTSLLYNVTKRFDGNSDSFVISLSDWQPLRDEVLSVGISAFYNGTLSFKDAAKNAADGIYMSLAVLASILFACFDFGFRATYFVGALFFLVSREKSFLQSVMESILGVFAQAKRSNSISSESGATTTSTDVFELDEAEEERYKAFKHFEDELRSTFRAVFAVPVTLAGANALASLTIFSILNLFGASMNASYFAALLALVFTVIPVISPFLSCSPWCIVASVVHGKHWAALALLLLHYLAFSLIDSYVLSSFHGDRRQHSSTTQGSFRSYLTGLSFFFGITSMGIHGIVLGPLIVSVFYTTGEVIMAQYRDVVTKQHRHRRNRSLNGNGNGLL